MGMMTLSEMFRIMESIPFSQSAIASRIACMFYLPKAIVKKFLMIHLSALPHLCLWQGTKIARLS